MKRHIVHLLAVSKAHRGVCTAKVELLRAVNPFYIIWLCVIL